MKMEKGMEEKKYHHGDLRNSLIEEGIRLMNEEGKSAFSLRRVATRCGVSNAAPYAHFSGKEELLEAMQKHVTDLFSKELKESYQVSLDDTKSLDLAMLQMGKCYVMFFVKNPQYYQFLFSQTNMRIYLTVQDHEDDYPPYAILKKAVFDLLVDAPLGEEEKLDAVISSWALVHGLSAIATMDHVVYEHSWEEKILGLITHR